MGISSIAKSGDLSANLKRVCASEWKAEINNFLRNCVNDGFRFEDIVEERTNKMVKHVGRETIQVK